MESSIKKRETDNNNQHTLISLKRGVAAAEPTAERERRIATPREMNMVQDYNDKGRLLFIIIRKVILNAEKLAEKKPIVEFERWHQGDSRDRRV